MTIGAFGDIIPIAEGQHEEQIPDVEDCAGHYVHSYAAIVGDDGMFGRSAAARRANSHATGNPAGSPAYDCAAHIRAYSDASAHAHGYPNSYTHSNTDSNTYTNTDADSHGHSSSYTDPYAATDDHAGSNAYTHCYARPDANLHATTDTDSTQPDYEVAVRLLAGAQSAGTGSTTSAIALD